MKQDTQVRVTAPASSYRDVDMYERERRALFGRAWLFMGHVNELPREGDVISATIAGYPLLVVRSAVGLKAFHNVCRHRAAPLVEGERSHCGQMLTCKYHGWVYTLDGRLRNARDFGAMAGFDPRDYGLFELQVQIWRDFIFVNASADVPALADTLAPLDQKLGGRQFNHLVHVQRDTHDIACNWKLYVENYLEGYHIPPVHPGLNASVDALKYEVTVDGSICFHSAPLKDNVAQAAHDGVWAFALPHLGLNSYGDDGVMWERMVPMGLNRTRLIYDYYFSPAIAGDEREKSRIISASGTVTVEDKWICELVQANIEAGVYDRGVLSPKHERGVAWFQSFISSQLETNR